MKKITQRKILKYNGAKFEIVFTTDEVEYFTSIKKR